jgi:hypothetical protein
VQELSFDAQAIVGAAATNKEIEYAAIELLDQVEKVFRSASRTFSMLFLFLIA